MVSIAPVSRALVPVDSDAAQRLSAPNYDEFQSDREVWDLLQQRPENVLRITMAHCHVPSPDRITKDGSPDALAHATTEMDALKSGKLVREVEDLLWVYEIVSPRRPEMRQIGLGGFGRTGDIRTESNPQGTIVRNEGIHPHKAEGRAKLIKAVDAYIGTVNCAVQDTSGAFTAILEELANARDCDYEATDEAGNRHRVWLVSDAMDHERLQQALEKEPAAYVADGNHRSAAAVMVGQEHFLAVFFPTSRMHLEPYNRLLPAGPLQPAQFLEKLSKTFHVKRLGKQTGFRPEKVNEIGLYHAGEWHLLTPRDGVVPRNDAAGSIDAAILQQHVLDALLGLSDARDPSINYVGGNKDAAYLQQRVDAGDYTYALSLAPVTMDQFVAVCEQNAFMPPKSTWFDPKIRSGLVIALLD